MAREIRKECLRFISIWSVAVVLVFLTPIECQRPGSPTEEAAKVLTDLRMRFAVEAVRGARTATNSEQPTSLLPPGLAERFELEPDGLRPKFGATVGKSEAAVLLPARSTMPAQIEDDSSGAHVEVLLQDARDVPAHSADGYLVYPRAHASGATALHRALPTGMEDFLVFEQPPAITEIMYRLDMGKGVSGLRLVANTLEVLDRDGAPRLRVTPPYLVGADGVQNSATLSVGGCRVDTNPAAPWGRSVTAPGARSCTVSVSWNDQGVVYPAILDPRWITTGSMTTARQGHSATLLATGKVLVAGGGTSSTTALATAELFDPGTGTWATTGSMTGARQLHTAIQLNTSSNMTTSGKVLVAGGVNGTTSLNTAQLYSPTAGTWTAAGNLSAPRHGHAAALLADGRVLVVGGLNGTSILMSAAIYNPASAGGSWAATTGQLPSPQKFHTATLLVTSNTQLANKVLVVGGNNGSATLSTAYLFNPAQSAFSTLASMPSPHEGHTATVLPNGNVLIAGGRNGSTTVATAALFNPGFGPGSWSLAGTMTSPRQGHQATALRPGIVANGQVLVTGGSNGTNSVATAELFNGTSTWTATTAMAAPVQAHTATLLVSSSVLIAGGINGTTTISAARLYDASFAVSCTGNSQCTTGFCVSGVCCDTACTATCGACNLTGKVGTCSAVSSGTVCRLPAGVCDVAETCNGTSLTCPADAFASSSTVCRTAAGVCDVAERCTGTNAACPSDGKVANGTTCDDSNLCTIGDACQGGICTGGAKTCPALDQCHTAGACNSSTGACSTPIALNGTACSDLNACTQGDSCQAGACTPGAPVTCTTDECHTIGVCVPATGCPAAVAMADNTVCSDGNACTVLDRCQAGVCTPGPNVPCPGDACHPTGTCDVVSGFCSIPLPYPDGTSCDDGNRCSIRDTCIAGGCIPGDTTNGCAGPTDSYYVPVVNLGSRQGASYAVAINNAGEVTGVDGHASFVRELTFGSGPDVGFRWTESGGMVPLPQPAGMAVFPRGINASGVIAGTTWDIPNGGSRVFRFDPSTNTQLQILTIPTGEGTAISDAGVVTGGGAFDLSGYRMFRALGSNVETLPKPNGDLTTEAEAIDQFGSLVGFTLRADRATVAAMRYTDARGLEYLNQLVPAGSDWNLDPVIGGDFLNTAFGTNGGQIVGIGNTGNGLTRSFVLTLGADGTPASSTIKQIGMIPRFPNDANRMVAAHAINRAGEVAGAVTDYSGIHPLAAFIWVDGTGIVDLNDLIDPASGWGLNGVFAINDNREVVGWGYLNGQQRAFKMKVPDLRPCPGADSCHSVGLRNLRTGACPAPVLLSGIASCQAGIVLRVDGVADAGNGQLVAVFGFDNAASTSIHPTSNAVHLGATLVTNPVPAPPTDFASGSHPGTFLPVFSSQQVISWTVDGQTVTASSSSPHLPALPVVTPGTPVRSGRIEVENFDLMSGGFNTGTKVERLSAGAWMLYHAVDFGSPGQFNRVRFNLMSPTGVDEVAIHLDSLDGQTVAALPTLRTGTTYAIESAALAANVWGVHDTYLAVTGPELVGIDWFELYKGPTRNMTVLNPGPRPPAGQIPDLSGLPAMDQEDAPANAVWLPLNQNIAIQAQAAEGLALSLTQPATVTAHVEWKGGAGPVTLSFFDQASNPIPPAISHVYPADHAIEVQTSLLSPQTIIVSVRNNGSSAITTNLQVGAVPSSP